MGSHSSIPTVHAYPSAVQNSPLASEVGAVRVAVTVVWRSVVLGSGAAPVVVAVALSSEEGTVCPVSEATVRVSPVVQVIGS